MQTRVCPDFIETFKNYVATYAGGLTDECFRKVHEFWRFGEYCRVIEALKRHPYNTLTNLLYVDAYSLDCQVDYYKQKEGIVRRIANSIFAKCDQDTSFYFSELCDEFDGFCPYRYENGFRSRWRYRKVDKLYQTAEHILSLTYDVDKSIKLLSGNLPVKNSILYIRQYKENTTVNKEYFRVGNKPVLRIGLETYRYDSFREMVLDGWICYESENQ